MKRLSVALLVLPLASVACGGGDASGGGQKRFLLLTRNPLSGQVAAAGDGALLDLGRRACTEMDSNISSDQIVADLGGNPEPGSAQFNAYSYIVVTAATELCPAHKAIFSTPGLP